MPFQPMSNAFAEWIMIEVSANRLDGAIRDGNRIHKPFITHFLRAKEAHIERGSLNMFEPSSEKEVATLHLEGHSFTRASDAGGDIFNEFSRHPFVSVKVKHPRILERDIMQTPVLMGRPIVELSLGKPRASISRYLHCTICTERVEDMNVIRPVNRLETTRKALLLVLSWNQY
jgi:hypothetical protein